MLLHYATLTEYFLGYDSMAQQLRAGSSQNQAQGLPPRPHPSGQSAGSPLQNVRVYEFVPWYVSGHDPFTIPEVTTSLRLHANSVLPRETIYTTTTRKRHESRPGGEIERRNKAVQEKLFATVDYVWDKCIVQIGNGKALAEYKRLKADPDWDPYSREWRDLFVHRNGTLPQLEMRFTAEKAHEFCRLLRLAADEIADSMVKPDMYTNLHTKLTKWFKQEVGTTALDSGWKMWRIVQMLTRVFEQFGDPEVVCDTNPDPKSRDWEDWPAASFVGAGFFSNEREGFQKMPPSFFFDGLVRLGTALNPEVFNTNDVINQIFVNMCLGRARNYSRRSYDQVTKSVNNHTQLATRAKPNGREEGDLDEWYSTRTRESVSRWTMLSIQKLDPTQEVIVEDGDPLNDLVNADDLGSYMVRNPLWIACDQEGAYPYHSIKKPDSRIKHLEWDSSAWRCFLKDTEGEVEDIIIENMKDVYNNRPTWCIELLRDRAPTAAPGQATRRSIVRGSQLQRSRSMPHSQFLPQRYPRHQANYSRGDTYYPQEHQQRNYGRGNMNRHRVDRYGNEYDPNYDPHMHNMYGHEPLQRRGRPRQRYEDEEEDVWEDPRARHGDPITQPGSEDEGYDPQQP